MPNWIEKVLDMLELSFKLELKAENKYIQIIASYCGIQYNGSIELPVYRPSLHWIVEIMARK